MDIEFSNGSRIEEYDEKKRHEILIVGRGNGKETAKLKALLEAEAERMKYQGDIKFLDKDGIEQASIPAHSDLLNAIVGYDHDPQTHDYNRAERRRIIKMAKKLDKKYGKKK